MTLENYCFRAFDAVTRARGEDHFRSGLVSLELIAPSAAKFRVKEETARDLSQNSVCLDWSGAEDHGVIRSSCSCDSYQRRGELCQHIWATILGMDGSKQRELETARSRAAKYASSNKRLSLEPLPSEASAELLRESIDIEASLTWPFEVTEPVGVAQFERPKESPESFGLQVVFGYGNLEVGSTSTDQILLDPARSRRIKRNLKAEKALLKIFKGQSALAKLTSAPLGEQDALSLMKTLKHAGWRVELDKKSVMLFSGMEGVLRAFDGGFGFVAAFDFSGQKISLRTFTDACLRRDRFVELAPSFVGPLPEDWVKRIELLSRCARFSKEGFMLVSRASMPLLEPVFAEAKGVLMDPASQRIFASLKSLAVSGHSEKPAGLRANLRPYQSEGLFWLEKIAASGFGGILADDMGLGKTIQIISYLLRRTALLKDEPRLRRPSLVVMPKSLVFNWLSEVAKFSPGLKVLDFASPKRGLLMTQRYDVVVTTYHVLKNELERLERIEFDSVILDEAQAIKNPTSQVAQAVYKIKGKHRFALSGTPIENSLGDLFSLMRFTNPGLIPSTLASALGDGRPADTSKEVLERLSMAVRPFILRRTKKQVLTELPDKCEQTLLCDLEGPQKKMYDSLRRHYKASLKRGFTDKGSGKSGIQVFEAILRLRQASCHPGLVDETQAKELSAKFIVLLEHLEEIRSSGNKALVFSQFASLLRLLKPHLKEAGLPFEYLDGQTRDRGAVVDRFNGNPDTTVFLISLKAGGTGLNLTSASYVFLLDPWWNPAAEAQAIDRAYRMGQKNKVMAYRLIAEGTIEEKIMRLQEQKRSLAEVVIGEEQSLLRSLSMDDLASLFD